MKNSPLVAHMIVRNESYWAPYSLLAAAPFVSEIHIRDTGSTDDTVSRLEKALSLIPSDTRVVFVKDPLSNQQVKRRFADLRNEQANATPLDKWVLIVDGDEPYPAHIFHKVLPKLFKKSSLAAVSLFSAYLKFDPLRLDVSKYFQGGKTLPRLFHNGKVRWHGEYPLDGRTPGEEPVISLDGNLAECYKKVTIKGVRDKWWRFPKLNLSLPPRFAYPHASFLPRSPNDSAAVGRVSRQQRGLRSSEYIYYWGVYPEALKKYSKEFPNPALVGWENIQSEGDFCLRDVLLGLNLPVPDDFYEKAYYNPVDGAKYSCYSGYEGKPRKAIESLISKVATEFNPSGRFLDIGCALGFSVAFLRNKGVDAYGIDLSHYAIAFAQNKFGQEFFQVASATELPFPDKHFDLVFSSDCVEHLTESQLIEMLSEVSRVASRACIYTAHANNAFEYARLAKDKSHVTLKPSSWWLEFVRKHASIPVEVRFH